MSVRRYPEGWRRHLGGIYTREGTASYVEGADGAGTGFPFAGYLAPRAPLRSDLPPGHVLKFGTVLKTMIAVDRALSDQGRDAA